MDDNKQGGILNRAAEFIEKLKNIIRQYPAAIGAFFAASLFFAFLEIHFDETVMNMAMFVYRFSLGALFSEELLKSELIKRNEKLNGKGTKIIFLLLAASVSALLTFGGSKAGAGKMISRYRAVFYAFTVLGTVYMMCIRLRTDFETYVISVFINVFRATLLYGLFAAGLAVLYVIFYYLLYSADFSYLAMLETVLGAGIYVPALIISFSSVEGTGKDAKFAKIVIGYSMTGLLSAAFILVYFYILKIMITGDLPKNELFAIVTGIFAAGSFIWTMGSYYRDDLPGKISKLLPIAFAPLIILQGICIGIRISAYGITPTRYAGIAVILFECTYLFLYIFRKGKHVSMILPAAVIFLALSLLAPGVNAFAVSVASQGERLGKILENGPENLSHNDKIQASDLYDRIGSYSREGKSYLEKEYGSSRDGFLEYIDLSEEEAEQRNSDPDGSTYVYTDSSMPVNLDISAYSPMDFIVCDMYCEDETVDLTQMPFCCTNDRWHDGSEDSTPDYLLDLEDIINGYERSGYDSGYFKENNGFILPDGSMLFINSLNGSFSDEGKAETIEIDAFIFNK